jgi:general secretion pathway protein M
MALAVDQGNSRLTAVLLLVIAVMLVYLLGFHWFILRHVEYSSDISTLADQLGRFEQVASQRAFYEEQLELLQARRSDENLFLEEGDFNEAAAAMSERLSQMVATQASDTCQIVSRQPVRSRIEERFERVTVNVRMRCEIEDVLQILHSLETRVPMIIADEMTIIKPRTRRRSSSRIQVSQDSLDIRFNMYGYLRSGAQS